MGGNKHLGPGDGPKSREWDYASREVRYYTKYTIYYILHTLLIG